jgi:tetratricopeptide (TPR) repeat protein
MATRSIDSGDDVVSLPVLTQPAPGENLVTMPRQFRWRGIRGVPLYRVTVYNSSEVMWQTTTAEASVRWPVKDCDFASGQTYYWVVEALVGNTILRSQAGEFTLYDRESSANLTKALGEAGASVSDPAGSLTLKARICLDSRAYSKAMEVLNESIDAAPSAEAYALRAEVNGAIGRSEDAIADYREAISLSATD